MNPGHDDVPSTDELKAEIMADFDRQAATGPRPGAFGGSDHCPVCKSTAFKVKRSRRGKVLGAAFGGAGVAAAPKTRVKCLGCGTEYQRT